MAVPKVMTGARAIVRVTKGEIVSTVGIYTNVSYGLTFDAQPAYILGRYSAAEIDYTAQEIVQIQASGWRVIGAGAHTLPAVPKLQDLLTFDYLTFSVLDRAPSTDGAIATISQVRPTGYSTSLVSRQLSEISVNYVGILLEDEEGSHTEDGIFNSLP